MAAWLWVTRSRRYLSSTSFTTFVIRRNENETEFRTMSNCYNSTAKCRSIRIHWILKFETLFPKRKFNQRSYQNGQRKLEKNHKQPKIQLTQAILGKESPAADRVNGTLLRDCFYPSLVAFLMSEHLEGRKSGRELQGRSCALEGAHTRRLTYTQSES